MQIGIIREGKIPSDKRVPFTPMQCLELMRKFPGLKVVIQPSPIRCYSDEEYSAFGLSLSEDLSQCDVIMGIKEVPIKQLIENKRYFFFSHTIKKQPYNRPLMQALIQKNVSMVDYECLTDESKNRIIGFGRYAGIVGAYNGIRGYGLKHDLFRIKPAHECRDHNEVETELGRVKLPDIKIILTGGGRVANGVIETLGTLKIRKVTPYEFLNFNFDEPVYCQLHSNDYYTSKDGSEWQSKTFYKHPEQFTSNFLPFASQCDLLITAHFWNPKAEKLFTKDDMKSTQFRINSIADITCDINGSVPSTIRSSTISNPFYGYNPITEKEDVPFSNKTVCIMAVDNLPCELPRDASLDFGKELIQHVMPALIQEDPTNIIERATICEDGKLNQAFNYLSDYAFDL